MLAHMTAITPRHRKPLTDAQIAQRRAAAAKPRMKGAPLSAAQVAQRRAASEAAMGHHTGPVTEAGKAVTSRNAWKHGQRSAAVQLQRDLVGTSIAGSFGRPCKTSCQWHPDNPKRTDMPCSLVTSGQTKAGGDCLDKRVFLEGFDALMAALQSGEMDQMNGVIASNLAANLQVIQQLREDIAANGTTLIVPALSKEGHVLRDVNGRVVVSKVILNPAVMALVRMFESMGLNLPEAMATPRAREKLKDDNDRTDTMSALLGAVMNRFGGNAPPRAQRTALDHDDADA